MESKNEKNDDYNYILNVLELKNVLNREVENLSGGELQRFALGMTCVQDANVYMFDEPSSYLDVKQRLRAAEIIRSLLNPTTYIICVEHDLSVLDYLSDLFVSFMVLHPFMVWLHYQHLSEKGSIFSWMVISQPRTCDSELNRCNSDWPTPQMI